MRRSTLASIAAALASLAASASAPGQPPDAGELIAARTDTADEPRLSPWQSDEDSLFVSGTTDAGIIYVRPRVMLGYGSPHWKYVALDAYVTTTNSFTSPYVGWRATFPFLDAFFGVRSVYPFDRRFLTPRRRHTGDDLSLERGGKRSQYNVVEHEISALAPLLHGIAYAQVHPLLVDAPSNRHVFEERIRAVMAPPFAMNTRLGYFYGIGDEQKVKAGLITEYVVLPDRPKNVLRAGPLFLVEVSPTLDAMGAFSAVLDSPDSLGVFHGPYAFLGILHRWARRL